MKKITASISADMDLLAKFDAAADQYRLSRSAVIKDYMEAYLELCQSANRRRLPGLEFKGFEQDAVKDPVLEINPQFRVFVNDFQYFRACVTGWLSQIPTLLMEMCDYVLSPAKFPAFILTRFR